jgi:hypothetical protein
MEMMKMEKNMEISHTKSNTRGIRISVYLRAEDLETLNILAKAFGNDKSKTIRFMLQVVKGWLDALVEKKPEFITSMIQKEMAKIMNETQNL